MTTKQLLLTLTIIASTAFAAKADPVTPVGPSAVPANGTAVVATASAPYVTITPTAADESHIATTAYVKGAYNDAIAAVNKLNSDKQAKIIHNETGNVMRAEALGVTAGDDIARTVINHSENAEYNNASPYLLAADGFMAGMAVMRDYTDNKTVTIYTTWDDDSDTTEVQLTTEY